MKFRENEIIDKGQLEENKYYYLKERSCLCLFNNGEFLDQKNRIVKDQNITPFYRSDVKYTGDIKNDNEHFSKEHYNFIKNEIISNRTLYSAVFLDKEASEFLNNKFKHLKDKNSDWKDYCHHMTICLGDLDENLTSRIGENTNLNCYEIGVSYELGVITLKVETDIDISDNRTPHITLFTRDNVKPETSNKITDWEAIEPFTITGLISYINKNKEIFKPLKRKKLKI